MRLTPRAALLLPAFLSACVLGPRGRVPAAASAAAVEVRNAFPGPVDVYVVRDGTAQATRLGQVPTGNARRFRVDATLLGGGVGNLTFVAQPPATQSRVSSGSLAVRPGDVVRFEIAPDLRSSRAYVQ